MIKSSKDRANTSRGMRREINCGENNISKFVPLRKKKKKFRGIKKYSHELKK